MRPALKRLFSARFETQSQEKTHENLWQQLRALTGAERRLVEAVLIHKHRARLSPRVIPGPSQFVALFLRGNHAEVLGIDFPMLHALGSAFSAIHTAMTK